MAEVKRTVAAGVGRRAALVAAGGMRGVGHHVVLVVVDWYCRYSYVKQGSDNCSCLLPTRCILYVYTIQHGDQLFVEDTRGRSVIVHTVHRRRDKYFQLYAGTSPCEQEIKVKYP